MAQLIFTKNGFSIEDPQTSLEKDLAQKPYETLYQQGFTDENKNDDPAISFLIELAQCFVTELKNDGDIEITRSFQFPEDFSFETWSKKVPFTLGMELVDALWIKNYFQQLSLLFEKEISTYPESIETYIREKNAKLTVAGRVYFHLVESKREDFPFAFMATYATGTKQKVNHVPLKNSLTEFKEPTEIVKLLGAVGRVTKESAFISQLVESGELFSPLKFSAPEAYLFLKEIPIYERNGVICRIPNFWKKTIKSRVSVSIGEKEPSKLGMDTLLSCQPEIYLGAEKFSPNEIAALLKENEGLAFLKGKWVEINHEKLQHLLDTYQEMASKEVSFFDALHETNTTNSDDEEILEIKNGEWLNQFLAQMQTPQTIVQKAPEPTFQATLRPYQKTGYNWLHFMEKNHFGALLADDMGLGKTIQILALLDSLKKQQYKSLLVIPASLIENWKKEAARFAPNLTLQVLHGKETDFDLTKADLFITTYAMVRRIDGLLDTSFDLLIIDEAQAIKNPGTKQTKTIKQIQAKARIAMNGTPIENQLSDLWSVFDFLNHGLLGNKKEFSQQTKKQLDYAKLRQMISPFILRRLKTDKKIISDLPDKNENKEYIALSKKQIALYKGIQKDIEKKLETSEGIQRKGLVLSAISKFKQVCNHPDQYLGNQEFKPANSGKFEHLKEICETIRDKHEQVIIFTQFKEMCGPLDDFLAEIFQKRGLILHGGTPTKKRGKLVETFNDPTTYTPYMVLSIKAGGVGLNLTAANHVIHFDRWWNPAIEEQATDRAFRIGQQKNVFVYKFVSSGTIEEKIDDMLESKKQLSDELITTTSGESWLTEMNNEDLKQLFSLEVDN